MGRRARARADAGNTLRGVLAPRVRSKSETLPQPHEFRPPLARRPRVRGLSRASALGAGRGRGAFALSELPDHGWTTLRAGVASSNGVHFPAGVGVRPYPHSGSPAPVTR